LAQTSSVLAKAGNDQQQNATRGAADEPRGDPAGRLHGLSWFTVPEPAPISYRRHDLVQIVIRETSTARSDQSLDTNKEYDIKGDIKAFPQLTLNDILDGVLKAKANNSPAKLDLGFENEFKGDGQYARKDDLSARITAEIIEILPNGNLVLEARTHIQTDKEISTIMLSGVCDPEFISRAGLIQSNQLFDLRVIKLHEGELRNAARKGLIPRVLDTIFAF
jgi:flagellar L-ring protein precursor FlgH